MLGEIVATTRYGIEGVRIVGSADPDDVWLPDPGAAIRRICRRAGVDLPYYRGGSGIRVGGGFRIAPPDPDHDDL